MKKLVVSFLFFFWVISSAYAHVSSMPDELSVREHWISLTKSYDIETRTQKLGTLYRRFFSLLLTYDFYDPMNVHVATASARFFSFGVYLDIYDKANNLIGGVDEKIFTFFPAFDVFAPDASTKLARAEMNFWGTKFYIYDPETNAEMAIMSRPFFRFKNDWTITVTNRALLDHKNVDSRVLMTVLAVQGEIDDWKKDNQDKSLRAAAATLQKDTSKYTQQIKTLSDKVGVSGTVVPSDDTLEATADELEQEFNALNPVIEQQQQSNDERIQAFIAYCSKQLESQDVSDAKKKEIMTLLNLRFQGHN